MKIIDIIRNPKFDKTFVVQKLIMHKLGITKEDLFKDTEKELSDEQVSWIYRSYSEYVEEDKPLAYIIGFEEFLGVKFNVTPATLIPRPETEYMITAVNERVSEQVGVIENLLDIGSGCGVLGCSVLYHNPGRIIHALFSDISEDALDVAQRNYKQLLGEKRELGADTFVSGSMLEPKVIKDTFMRAKPNSPILLVANLPYIPESLFNENTEESVKKREPKFAFVGGDDGLDWYRIMFNQLLEYRKQNIYECTQFLEMMTWQIEILRNEFGSFFIFEEVKTFHFNIRIVKAVFA